MHLGELSRPLPVAGSVVDVYLVRPLFPGSAASPRHRGKQGGNQQWRWPEFQLWGQLPASNYRSLPVRTGLVRHLRGGVGGTDPNSLQGTQ